MPRRSLTPSLVVLGLLLGAIAVIGPCSPAAATIGPYSSWTMRSDPDDDILQGEEYYYDGSQMHSISGDQGRVMASVQDWDVVIAAPAGEDLEVGRTYTGATRATFAQDGEPGLDLSGRGRGCNELTGSFTVHELTFSLLGDLESVVFTFEQHCEGDAPAAYGSVAWQASQPAPTLPPRLYVGFPHRRVAYAGTAMLEAQLSRDSPIRELSVYGQTKGDPARLMRTVTVDNAGHASIPVSLTETTRLTVRFDGRGQYPSLSQERIVVAEGKVTSTMKRAVRKKGRYYIYRPSQDPLIRSVLHPNHRGDCLKFRAEFLYQGVWGYDAIVRCVRLDKRSSGIVRFLGDPRLVGIPVRMRSEWDGDARNAEANGRWQYFKFVR
jgi:hypothetical protein